MKLAALLFGIMASALAWAASYYLIDLEAAYLALWPDSNSQQLFGIVSWHGIVASSLLGGLLTVFAPLLGAFVLAAAAAAWGLLGTQLPVGFDIQILAPLGLSAAGSLAAFGAALRGHVRRRAERRPPSSEEAAREQALRLEPSVDLRRALEEEFPGMAAAERPPLGPDPEPEPEAYAEPEGFSEPDEPAPVPTAATRRPPGRAAGTGAGFAALAAVNVFVLLLLSGAVGLLLYSEYRSGALADAFALAGPQPAIAPAEDTVAAGGADTGTEGASSAVLTAGLNARSSGEPEVRITTMPLEPELIDEETWTDPFAYCAAVGTMDTPDRRYVGPPLAAEVADALDVPQSSPPDRARWRCADGVVMACASFEWPVCAPTPSDTEMAEFCAANPDQRGLQAPSGRWHCNGAEPEVPVAWPVDERGFLPRAWVAIPAPGTTDAADAAG